MTEFTDTPTADNGTLDPAPGTERSVTLADLIAGTRPMTVLARVEAAALGTLTMTKEEIAAAKLFLGKTQPDLKAVEHSGEVGVSLSEQMRAILERNSGQ